MIRIPRPSMAMHSHDVPGFKYKLENNFHVPPNDPVDHMLGWVATYARSREKLAVLVINCHGAERDLDGDGTANGGYGLRIGESIRIWHAPKFAVLKGLVQSIVITACETARISRVDTDGAGDGNLLCGAIAKESGANVVASSNTQYPALWLPDDCIDDWEGLVMVYGPDGGVRSSVDYGWFY